ncbi:TPA: hypothetical protein ACSP88_003469 [Aeromonas hydrophila]
MIYEVKKCFHAVGNGTLFTGKIKNLIEDGASFNWIYDCGSTSKKTVLKTVSNLPSWFGPANQLDMLVLSHFDDDHINGLEVLLKNYYVKRLVLPFTEWPQKIREISVMGQRGITPSSALFQINPTRWLEVHDFINQVGEIILVQGQNGESESGRPSSGPDYDRPRRPDRNFPSEVQPENEWGFPIDEATTASVFLDFGPSKKRKVINIKKIHHGQPIHAYNNSFEFIFYNAEKDFSALGLIYESSGQRFSKKSMMPIQNVKADIEKTIISLGLHQGVGGLPVGWRQTLKNCYEKHFGRTGEAKNNISLCMYAAPLDKHFIFTDHPATLLTGDINLTHDVIDDMQIHFGNHRWRLLGRVQVPHHGSQHYWAVGNATRFENAQFVQCATPTKHHPHRAVTADLNFAGSIVHHANRTTAISSGYFYYQFC